jgi:hypothetical protein
MFTKAPFTTNLLSEFPTQENPHVGTEQNGHWHANAEWVSGRIELVGDGTYQVISDEDYVWTQVRYGQSGVSTNHLHKGELLKATYEGE